MNAHTIPQFFPLVAQRLVWTDHLIEMRVRTKPTFLATILLKSLPLIGDYEMIQISEL